MRYALGSALEQEVGAVLRQWQAAGNPGRIWNRDPLLWTGDDEDQWLGWLDITRRQLARIQELEDFAAQVREAGYTSAVVLGMGGSSLCPEVLAMTFHHVPGFPKLHVLDSTDPAQVRSLEDRVDLDRTLFLVASKSGSTLEPTIFKEYFFDRVGRAGRQFAAVTDPGSKLEREARADGFGSIFHGVPEIGGRFSALSHFGMAPAAAMGLDIRRFLESAQRMVDACGPDVPAGQNPGVQLGVVLGVAAAVGRDKLTLITSPTIWDLGAWLEQLVAESTGKQGKAIIPVDGETLAPPEIYGDDRLFVYTRLESAPNAAQDAAVDALEAAGHPVVRIPLADIYDLGQEFFRWEFATAVAGAILEVNPFNQPDVQFSKTETRKLTDAYESAGSLPAEQPFFEQDGIRLFADARNAAALTPGEKTLAGYLRAHLDRVRKGDYFATLAYIEMTRRHIEPLQALRGRVRRQKGAATCLGFGPRFLHSTGQAYKAGPDTGVFLQITCDDANDLPVPGRQYTFGVVKAAQARGDFQVLADRGRRALRVHLGRNVTADLERVLGMIAH